MTLQNPLSKLARKAYSLRSTGSCKVVSTPFFTDTGALYRQNQSSRMNIWMDINEKQGVGPGIADKWWNQIVHRYSEPQRHYHTLTHVQDMLKHLEEHAEKLQDANAVAFAVIFHDVIYEPKAPDNEEKSAVMFQEFAKEANLQPSVTESVVKWILATKAHSTPEHHQNDPASVSDLHYLLDFDMSVLAWPEEDYKRYAEQIRQEFIHFPDAEFRSKRAVALKQFLTVPYIFATPEYRLKCEGRARENIQKEITRLTAGT